MSPRRTRILVGVVLLGGALAALVRLKDQEAEALRRQEALAARFGSVVMVDGIPHVDYGALGVHANPVTVAEWGLADGDLIAAAHWLVEAQHADGSWRYDFDYRVTGRVVLEAGWASSMAQGLAMSVLARAFVQTGDERFSLAARRAVDFLAVPVSGGGVRTVLDTGLWFEEYPTDPPSYVLNGFIFTLAGLWDVRELVPQASVLYEEARATLEAQRGRWDAGGVVSYDLLHERVGGDPLHLSDYDRIHEDVLRTLLEHRESAEVRFWFERWFPPPTNRAGG